MEKKEWIEGCKRVFTQLVKDTIWEDFTMPKGGMPDKYMGSCYDKLVHRFGAVSGERLADFCICQVFEHRTIISNSIWVNIGYTG